MRSSYQNTYICIDVLRRSYFRDRMGRFTREAVAGCGDCARDGECSFVPYFGLVLAIDTSTLICHLIRVTFYFCLFIIAVKKFIKKVYKKVYKKNSEKNVKYSIKNKADRHKSRAHTKELTHVKTLH